MDKQAFDEMNRAVIDEFRATGGKAGGIFEGKPLDDGRIFVFASKGGADTHPDWYRNLVAHPDVTVELGTETFRATARPLQGAERDEIYAKQVAVEPQFGDYQRSTTRVIPVVELVRAS